MWNAWATWHTIRDEKTRLEFALGLISDFQAPYSQPDRLSPMLDDPTAKVRDSALTSGKGYLFREDRWAYIHYGKAEELYDMGNDPKQYTNLVNDPEYAEVLAGLRKRLAAKLIEVRNNDLGKRE